MSREKCLHCSHVYSTTGHPNDAEGYFITSGQVEAMEFEVSEDYFCLHAWLREHCLDVERCPKCGEISLYDNDKRPKDL